MPKARLCRSRNPNPPQVLCEKIKGHPGPHRARQHEWHGYPVEPSRDSGMPPTQRALAKIVEAFLRLDKRQEKLESIAQATLRDARAHRLSPDSDTYRALVEAGMVEGS